MLWSSSRKGKHQECVDQLARETIELSKEELFSFDDYGLIYRDGIAVGFWHHVFGDEKHHIVFIAERNLLGFLPIYEKFIAGIVFGARIDPRIMTDEETTDYD